MRYLRKIKSINGFRCFAPFSWSEENCELFDRYNLIYGWNGAGKSTLGAFLHMLERHKLSNGITFDITCETEDGKKVRYSVEQHENMKLLIRVFHDRYIEDNIQSHDGIKHIYIIGKEQGEKVKKLEALKAEIAEHVAEHTKQIALASKKKQDYEHYCTKQASMIKKEAGLSANYNRNAFEQDCLRKVATVSDERYAQAKIALGAEYHPEIRLNAPRMVSEESVNTLLSLLEETPTNIAIAELQSNAALAQWVQDGLEFHSKSEVRCKFCGSLIKQERLEELASHFNQSYRKLIDRLAQMERYFGDIQDNNSRYIDLLPAVDSLYPEFRKEYEALLELFSREVVKYGKQCKQIISIIQSKKMDVVNSEYIEDIKQSLPFSDELRKVYADLLQLIQSHNLRSADNESYIKKARETIRCYWVYQLKKEWEKYYSDRANSEKTCAEIKKSIENKQGEEEQLSKQIRNSQIPAEQINRDIAFLMGRQEVVFEDCENGYRITRNGEVAQHLSKGEENAIALIYFFNTLQDETIDQKNTIVVLDDPISSFDSNFYFNAISYIKSKVEDVGQVFILTHKFSLLQDYKNMFHDSMFKMYQIDRKGEKPVIHKLDSQLHNFYDEYGYLFKRVYDFVKNPPRDKSEYLIYPNIARRVLESFLMFKVPKTSGSIIDKALRLASDRNSPAIHSIMRLLNDKSHLRVIPGKEISDAADELNAMPEILKNLLIFIRENDSCHFDTLVREFDSTYTGEESFDRDILKKDEKPIRGIKLFDMAVCAGDGFDPGNDKYAFEEYMTNNTEADYALRISGNSMEPKIPDGSIVLVKATQELQSKDVGIFIVDGEAMCKRYIDTGEKIILVPDNRNFERKDISDENVLLIQGKVVDIDLV